MLISLNWIKKFTDITLSTEELIPKIAAQIAEIEEVEDYSAKFKGIVVGHIKEAKDHPDADKLGVYQVDIGSGMVQVVAGDKTLAVGDHVAYIPPGTIVPATFGTSEPFEIKKTDLRGEESNGMLGSAKELSWGDSHEGVLKLDCDSQPGRSLIEAYELDDLIIEVENKTLTHRPDCFGMIGFAREVGAIQGNAFSSPDWYLDTNNPDESETPKTNVSIETENSDRYTAVSMKNVSIKESPILMQTYLSRVGIRPISNVVDVTNYLMVESGQPLHAFDEDKLIEHSSGDSASIVVRTPKKDEALTLLNGKTIKPHTDAVLIATDQEAVALGGVMGGSDTEVHSESTNILLEVANFDLYSIRKTSMTHGIFTDAVTRFIRGQDPAMCLAVSKRACQLLSEVADAEMASPYTDAYPRPSKKPAISVNTTFINTRLGAKYTDEQIISTLKNVEFEVTAEDSNLTVTAPPWRRDINIAEDVIEEVGRIIGYEKLAVTLPARNLSSEKLDDQHTLLIQARQTMVAAGANEILSYNFVSEKLFKDASLSVDDAYTLRNSISPELERLRTAMTPSLVEVVNQNIRAGHDEFALFEINKTHRKSYLKDSLPIEDYTLALTYAANEKVKNEEVNGASFYQARAYLELILTNLNVSYQLTKETDDEWVQIVSPAFSDQRSIVYMLDGNPIAVLGEYSAKTKNAFKLPRYSSGFEINLSRILRSSRSPRLYQPLSKFPSSYQDVTFALGPDVNHDQVESAMMNQFETSDLICTIELIDAYEKSNTQRNLTYRVTVHSESKTLETTEVNTLITDMIKTLETNLGISQVQ